MKCLRGLTSISTYPILSESVYGSMPLCREEGVQQVADVYEDICT